jgi:hypothetical protein
LQQSASAELRWKGTIMDDFPIWLRLLIWLVIGGTVAYAVGAIIYSAMMR